MEYSRFQFWVRGPLPGLNEHEKVARAHKMQAASMKKKWTTIVSEAIWIEAQGCVPKFKRVNIDFVWIERNRRRDPDNFSFAKKYVLDGMVKSGMIKGDGWRHVAGFIDVWKVGARPGVIVNVREAMEWRETNGRT